MVNLNPIGENSSLKSSIPKKQVGHVQKLPRDVVTREKSDSGAARDLKKWREALREHGNRPRSFYYMAGDTDKKGGQIDPEVARKLLGKPGDILDVIGKIKAENYLMHHAPIFFKDNSIAVGEGSGAYRLKVYKSDGSEAWGTTEKLHWEIMKDSSENLIYVAKEEDCFSSDGAAIFCRNKDGKILWKLGAGDKLKGKSEYGEKPYTDRDYIVTSPGRPLLDEKSNSVTLTVGKNALVNIDRDTGEANWINFFDEPVISGIVQRDKKGNYYVKLFHKMLSVSPDGKKRWEKKAINPRTGEGDSYFGRMAAGKDNHLYELSAHGELTGINMDNGEPELTYNTGWKTEDSILKENPVTGELDIVKQSRLHNHRTPLVLENGNVVLGDSYGRMVCLDPSETVEGKHGKEPAVVWEVKDMGKEYEIFAKDSKDRIYMGGDDLQVFKPDGSLFYRVPVKVTTPPGEIDEDTIMFGSGKDIIIAKPLAGMIEDGGGYIDKPDGKNVGGKANGAIDINGIIDKGDAVIIGGVSLRKNI